MSPDVGDLFALPHDRAQGVGQAGQEGLGGGGVRDGQHRPAGGEAVEQGPQPGLVVGQRLVVQPLASGVQGAGMVFALADVQPL